MQWEYGRRLAHTLRYADYSNDRDDLKYFGHDWVHVLE